MTTFPLNNLQSLFKILFLRPKCKILKNRNISKILWQYFQIIPKILKRQENETKNERNRRGPFFMLVLFNLKKKKTNKILKTIQPAGVSSQRFKVCMDYPLEFLNTTFPFCYFSSSTSIPSLPHLHPESTLDFVSAIFVYPPPGARCWCLDVFHLSCLRSKLRIFQSISKIYTNFLLLTKENKQKKTNEGAKKVASSTFFLPAVHSYFSLRQPYPTFSPHFLCQRRTYSKRE